MTKNRRVSTPETPEAPEQSNPFNAKQPAEGNEEGRRPSGFHTKKPGRSTGWTVTEQFEREGFSYRLMRRPISPDGDGPRLTPREEEALVQACLGFSNKRIAQALGVAPSTVGVLLFRAAAKLGVKSRQDLLIAYQRLRKSSVRI